MSVQVILSLIQQLAHDFSTATETKITWLSDIFADFDARAIHDPQLAQTATTVFDEALTNLRILFKGNPPSSPLHKQIKLLMTLVRAAMPK